MNKIRKQSLILLSVIAVLLLTFSGMPQAFAETNGGGGVQTNGEVGFYEESTSASSTTESSTKGTTTTSTLPSTLTKPTGKLPSTGELVVKSLSISGGIILIIGLLLFWWKRRRQVDERREH